MITAWLITWLVAAIAFAVVELATIQLVSVWFAVGSVAAMIACTTGAPIWVQILLFGVVSLVLLLLTRPFVKKFIKVRHTSTNADRLIGKIAVTTEPVDNQAATGAARVLGVTWMARSEDGTTIPEGEQVVIRRIEGAKLIVAQTHE